MVTRRQPIFIQLSRLSRILKFHFRIRNVESPKLLGSRTLNSQRPSPKNRRTLIPHPDFSSDSQPLVPKIVRESNSQAPKITELPSPHPCSERYLNYLSIYGYLNNFKCMIKFSTTNAGSY